MISVTTRPSARIVPVALAGVLVLGACGSDEPTADDGDSVPSADDDGRLAPTPVRTAGGGGNGGGAAVAAAESADGRMATDMMMPYRITNFVLADGLPALPTNDTGFVFQMGQEVTAEQVAALAAQLGVTGEPVRTDDGYSVSWRVGPEDGTAPSVWVYQDAMLSWSYNSAWATDPGYVGCAVAGSVGADGEAVAEEMVAEEAVAPDDGTVADEPVVETIDPAVDVPADTCAEPEPPTGVPTAEEAQAKATELITALGLDPAAFTFDTPYADEWSAFAGATEQINGFATGRRVDVGFGAEGAIQYAGGQLATPQQMGPYPLIGIDEALERLNDTSGFYGGGYGMLDMARSTVGGDVAVSSEIAAVPVESGEAAPPVDVTIDPMPVETLPPEEVTVTLTDVEADIWWAWDVDGSAYLLPAYRFIGDDGGWYTVPAVTDEYLVQVEPDEVPVPEPMPVPETTMPVDPVPVPETVPAGTVPVESVPVETLPVDSKPETEPTETIVEPELFDAAQLDASIGKSLADFTADAEALGAAVRVTVIDGVDQAVTMDYSTNRVNVSVEGGDGADAIVVAINGVG
jgi:hypothetical protein